MLPSQRAASSSQSLREPHHMPHPLCHVYVGTAATANRSYRRRMPHKAGRYDGSICGAMAVARKMMPLPSACAGTGNRPFCCVAMQHDRGHLCCTHTRVHARPYCTGSCARPPRMLLTPAGCIALHRESLGRANASASFDRSRLWSRIVSCCRSMRRRMRSRALSGQRKDRVGANAVLGSRTRCALGSTRINFSRRVSCLWRPQRVGLLI